jgi:hypothetical protein
VTRPDGRVGTPEEYVALLSGWVKRAGEEALRQSEAGRTPLPDDPADGLRLLVEYMHAERAGYGPYRVDPRGFAQVVGGLAFDERIPLPAEWPHTRRHIGRAFGALGFTGDPGDIHPITYSRVIRLVGHPGYVPRLVAFRPSLDELRHLDGPQSRIEVRIGRAEADPSLVGERAILADGTVLDATTRMDALGPRTERTVTAGAPLVSTKANARAQELAASSLLAEAYNAEHGTHYSPCYGDDRDVDITLGPLRVQVVRCSPQAAWEQASRDGLYRDSVDLVSAREEILGAVRKKAIHYGATGSLVLLVDGGIVGITGDLVATIGDDSQEELARAGFAEIWYASRTTGRAQRLWPR